jgi:hypothetical protein
MRITKELVKTTGICLSLGMLLLPVSADARQGSGGGSKGSQAGLSSIIAALPYQELSTEEEDGLMLMREEEKLARDVYQLLYEKWELAIFNDIALSEQSHMTAIKSLLDKYGLTDPVSGLGVGEFASTEMQDLYDSLVEVGMTSVLSALHVGATIEDLDIYDLYHLLEGTDNSDIKTVYENLVKGSRNHLRAFAYQLSINGETYEAQYLSQDEIDDILTSEWERGMVDENGSQVTGGKGSGNQTENGTR